MEFPQIWELVRGCLRSSSFVVERREMDSESESEVETRPTSKGKGKATEPKEIKRRSSKACE